MQGIKANVAAHISRGYLSMRPSCETNLDRHDRHIFDPLDLGSPGDVKHRD